MTQRFEDWLKSAWLEDENRAINKRQNNELREELKSRLTKTVADMEGREVCHCDGNGCTLCFDQGWDTV